MGPVPRGLSASWALTWSLLRWVISASLSLSKTLSHQDLWSWKVGYQGLVLCSGPWAGMALGVQVSLGSGLGPALSPHLGVFLSFFIQRFRTICVLVYKFMFHSLWLSLFLTVEFILGLSLSPQDQGIPCTQETVVLRGKFSESSSPSGALYLLIVSFFPPSI